MRLRIYASLLDSIKKAEKLSFEDYSAAISIVEQIENSTPFSDFQIAILCLLIGLTLISTWFLIKKATFSFMFGAVFFIAISSVFSLKLYDFYHLHQARQDKAIKIATAKAQYESIRKIVDDYIQKYYATAMFFPVIECRDSAKPMEIGTEKYWLECLPREMKRIRDRYRELNKAKENHEDSKQ